MYPILFSVWSVKIYTFGLFLVLSAIVGSFLIWREGRNLKLTEERLIDLILVTFFFGLLGARIYYIVFHFEDFGLNPFYWLLIFHFPGLSFVGGLLGGLVGTFFFSQRVGWSFWQVGDMAVLGVSLAEAIGRLGAFFAGSAYGISTDLPWGVSMVGLPSRRHPVQIYEALVALLIFFILLRFKNFWLKKNLPSGGNFLLYFFLLGASKFFLEFFRGDSVYLFGWRIGQIVYLIFFAAALALFYRYLGRSLKRDTLTILEKIKIKKQNV